MGRMLTLLTQAHKLTGPTLMLIYPLYASIVAIESQSKKDDEQWLAYWILYSFLTVAEMIFESVLEWIPMWYSLKLALVAWLVLPQFKGASFVYEKFVRDNIKKMPAFEKMKVHLNKNEKHKVDHDAYTTDGVGTSTNEERNMGY